MASHGKKRRPDRPRTNRATKIGVACIAIVFVALVEHARSASDEKTHEIRWRAAAKIGQQRRLISELTQVTQTRTIRGEETLRDHTMKNRLEFDGVVTVEAVDTSGRPTRVSVRVSRCVYRAGDDKPRPMLDKGSVVVGEVTDGQTLFRAKDKKKPLPSLAKTLLPKIIALAKSGPDEDTVFGNTRRRVGETWSADKKKLVEKFNALESGIREDDVSGSAVLNEVGTASSDDYVDLQFDMQAKTKKPGNPPTGMVAVSAQVKVDGKLRFPADYATDWTRQSLAIRFDATYRGKPNTKFAGQTMNFRSTQTIEAEAEYLKASE